MRNIDSRRMKAAGYRTKWRTSSLCTYVCTCMYIRGKGKGSFSRYSTYHGVPLRDLPWVTIQRKVDRRGWQSREGGGSTGDGEGVRICI